MRSQVFPKFFLHHGFVIGPVADVHFGDGVAFEDNQMRADAVEEPAVVAVDICDLFQSLILHAIVAEFVLLTEINSSSSIIDDEHGVIKDYQ